MSTTPTDPAPSNTARPDRDHRPGLRTLLVPRLIARGHTPAQTARTTGVPISLVALIAERQTVTPSPSLTRPLVYETPLTSQPQSARRRKNAFGARLLFIAAITIACAASILWHVPLLPIILIVAGILTGRSHRERLPAGRRHAPGR